MVWSLVYFYLEETSGELVLRKPYAYAEIPVQEIEKVILQKLPEGVAFTNVSFREIKIDCPVLPKIKVAIRAVPKNASIQLQPSSIAKLIAIDEISLLNRNYLEIFRLSEHKLYFLVRLDKRSNVPDAVTELLTRAYRAQRDPDRAYSPINITTEERQKRALNRMSADLISERQTREKLEDDKFELESELTKVRRDFKLRNTLIADGLENAQPEEIATQFSKLEKHLIL